MVEVDRKRKRKSLNMCFVSYHRIQTLSTAELVLNVYFVNHGDEGLFTAFESKSEYILNMQSQKTLHHDCS